MQVKHVMHRSSPHPPIRQFTTKDRIWLFGTSAWIVGIIDRTIAVFSRGDLTIVNGLQLLLVAICFGGWLYLKPRPSQTLLRSPIVKSSSQGEREH
jgi:hypothetical protein